MPFFRAPIITIMIPDPQKLPILLSQTLLYYIVEYLQYTDLHPQFDLNEENNNLELLSHCKKM